MARRLWPAVLLLAIPCGWLPRAACAERLIEMVFATQVVSDVPVNSFIVVSEGAPGFELAPRPRFELGAGGAAHGPHAGHGASGGGS